MTQDSWLAIPPGCHFSLANIPFGIISREESTSKHPAIAIGEHALDLQVFASEGGFDPLPSLQEQLSVFSQPTLNAFAALGRKTHRTVREYLQDVLSEKTSYPQVLKENAKLRKKALLPLEEIRNHMPMFIGDYTDFFAGINHAFNVGTMFRGPANALQPNYKHLPVGYHGRASSVVVSGTEIRRPRSQILQDPSAEVKVPVLMASKRLDIELELGAFLCKGNEMGENIPIDAAGDAIFGLVLMNDWSARDIQTWEYVPLGPFNAKNFGTSISAWVVLADALEPFRCAAINNENEILPYLKEQRKDNAYNIDLEVILETPSLTSTTISSTNARNLLWSFPQMLAHHSISGCPMNVGDLLGSGTISGTEDGTYGSFLEGCWGGKKDIPLNGGEKRKFLQDGDTVIIRGCCGKGEKGLVGFGECVGLIKPALI